jgi:selenophosphate synthetase-related protein
MLNNLTKEERAELNELLEQLKQIERLSEKSRKEKTMGEIIAVLVFLLTGSVMLYIESGVIGYLIWIALYGFVLYFIFGIRKSDVPEYAECVKAAKYTVSDCIKVIEHNQIAEIVYKDPEFYIEKYNKLIRYFPAADNKTLKRLIHQKPQNK